MIVDELTKEYVKCNIDTDEVEYSETAEMTKEEVRYRNTELRKSQSRWRWVESAFVDFDQSTEVA